MPEDSPNIIHRIREAIATSLGWDRTRYLAADDQTRLSWAKPVKSLADLPEIYHDFFHGLREEQKEPFPPAVLTPTFKGFLKPENEKLICRIGASLHVLEQIGNRLAAVEYPLDAIVYLETGTILLHSWLTINGVNALGNSAASTLKFNSVTEHLFVPFVEGFRSFVTGAEAAEGADAEMAKFEYLRDLNFKFMNYARRSIYPGEKVLSSVFQTSLRRKFIGGLSLPFTPPITPAHLTILTDRELILIRDDETQPWSKDRPYGGIWRYVPLRKISSVTLTGREDGLLVLSIRLVNSQRLEALFPESKRKEAAALQAQIKRQSGE